jgi:hypothetical protein
MDVSKMRNMVVLKNLPSNLIDEAIIILKPNKNLKKVDHAKGSSVGSSKQEQSKSDSKNYIINEAEMVISNYISSVQKMRKD